MKVRNKMLAHHAWDRWQWCYADMPCRADFARGFKDGYTDVVKGKTGCQPVLPPRFYWSVHYQNADGHCHINAWFDGYTHGAMAAAQDGYASAGRIPISPTARGNWMRQQHLLQQQQDQQNKAYYSGELEPVAAPYFGAGPGESAPAGSGGATGGSAPKANPPADVESPPRPYEEEARYYNPPGQQFLSPLPPATPVSDPAQSGLPIVTPLN